LEINGFFFVVVYSLCYSIIHGFVTVMQMRAALLMFNWTRSDIVVIGL